MEERIYCTRIELDTSKANIWENFRAYAQTITKEEAEEAPVQGYYTVDVISEHKYKLTRWSYNTNEKEYESIETFRRLEHRGLRPRLRGNKLIWEGAFDWWDTRPLTEEEIKAKAIAFLKPIIEQSGNIPLE